MGLDFHTGGIPYLEDLSFDEQAHWSYSGFNRFRERLAREIGAGCLKDVWAYDYHRQSTLYALLNHSDCDGELSPGECAILWPALEIAVRYWPDNDYDKVHALKLVAHMQACSKMNRPLVFA